MCSSPITPNLFDPVTSNKFQSIVNSVFILKLCKKRDNNNLHICCCIWYNNWYWAHSVNRKPVRLIFIWPEFLLLVLLGKSIFVEINSDNYYKVKPVSVFECYTTVFSQSLFLLKIWENVMPIAKKYCNQSRKSMSQQLLFEVSLLMFHFASALQYLEGNCNEYLVEQKMMLYLKLILKIAFSYNVFLIFGKIRLCLL